MALARCMRVVSAGWHMYCETNIGKELITSSQGLLMRRHRLEDVPTELKAGFTATFSPFSRRVLRSVARDLGHEEHHKNPESPVLQELNNYHNDTSITRLDVVD